MDILEIEDVLKGLPDQALRQEAQQPTGQVPQYMVVSEIQRRSKMRKRFEAQQEQPSTTVAEQILTGGVASVAPPPSQMMGAMGMPQQAPAPQQQPPMQPQQMPTKQPPMPQQDAPMPPPVRMQTGGKTVGGVSIEDSIRTALEDYGVPANVLKSNPKFSQYASLIDKISANMMSGVQVYDTAKTKANIPYGREFDSISPMPTQISPFGTYGMTREEFEAQRGPRIGDVKASDIYGDVSLPSLPDMPMIGTTPELQRRRAREELDPISPMRDRISDMGTYGSTPEEFDAIRGSLGVGKASSAFVKKFGEMTQESLDEAAPTRQFIVDLLSGKFAYEPESVARAKRGESLFPPSAETIGSPRTGAVDVAAAIAKAEADPYNTGFDYSNIPGPGMTDVVVDPKQSAATQNDAIKLNLDTATTKDPALLDMAVSEKNPMDYGLTDFSIDPDLQRQVNEIIGDRSELKPKGTSDIQTQGIKYTSPDIPALVAPNFAKMISEQERRLAKIREDAKRDVGAQALINLGAGIAEGDVSGGLVRAGEAAAKVRAAERAAESDIANLQTQIKMAEEQGRFDTAKALRADALKEAQFEATFGLKRGELAQTLQLAEARIEAEGNTEEGRMLRARLTALNDLASRLQAQVATTGIRDPATDAALQQALGQLQSLLGVKVAGLKDPLQLGVSAEAG